MRERAHRRALPGVPGVDQEHAGVGIGGNLAAHFVDVGLGRRTAAQGRREVRIHEPRALGRHVTVHIVGEDEVQADAIAILRRGASRGAREHHDRNRRVGAKHTDTPPQNPAATGTCSCAPRA